MDVYVGTYRCHSRSVDNILFISPDKLVVTIRMRSAARDIF